MNERTLNVKTTVTDQFLMDLLCTAVEGGIYYWAAVTDTVRIDGYEYVEATLVDMEEGEDSEPMTITLDLLFLGVQNLIDQYPWRISMLDDHDAEDADVAVQMALFGEVVYG
jgi:hypothetical protein